MRRRRAASVGHGPAGRGGPAQRHAPAHAGDRAGVDRTRRAAKRTFSAVKVVRAYARRTANVDRAILVCFVLGLPTRKVAPALLSVLGCRVSAATVSQVAKTRDAAVAA